MKKFKIEFAQHWIERGECEIEAENEEDARQQAKAMLTDGSDDIEWNPNFDPQEQSVDTVEEIE